MDSVEGSLWSHYRGGLNSRCSKPNFLTLIGKGNAKRRLSITKQINSPFGGSPVSRVLGNSAFHCSLHPRCCTRTVTTIITKLLLFTLFILPKASRVDKFVGKKASFGLFWRRISWVMVPKGTGSGKGKSPQRRWYQHPHGLRGSSYWTSSCSAISPVTSSYLSVLMIRLAPT